MAALVSRIFMRKQIATTPVKKMVVVEKNNTLATGAIATGSTVAKIGLVTGGLTYAGYEAQKLKSELFQNALSGTSTLGNLGDAIGDKFDSVKDNLLTGVMVVGGFIVVGFILKQSLK